MKIERNKIRAKLSKVCIDKLPAAMATTGARRNGRIFFLNPATGVFTINKINCTVIAAR